MHLYLDIDGVLIRDGQPTPNCFPFLRWAVDCHQPFWLTTRDAHGQHDGILAAFRHALGTPTLATEVETLLRAVKPTRWRGSKVSGIDLASDFVWIDDDPLQVEVDALRRLGLLHRLLIVDGDDGLLHLGDGGSFKMSQANQEKDAGRKAATKNDETLHEVFTKLISGNPQFQEAKKSGEAFVIVGHQPSPPDRKP